MYLAIASLPAFGRALLAIHEKNERKRLSSLSTLDGFCAGIILGRTLLFRHRYTSALIFSCHIVAALWPLVEIRPHIHQDRLEQALHALELLHSSFFVWL